MHEKHMFMNLSCFNKLSKKCERRKLFVNKNEDLHAAERRRQKKPVRKRR